MAASDERLVVATKGELHVLDAVDWRRRVDRPPRGR